MSHELRVNFDPDETIAGEQPWVNSTVKRY